MAFQPIADVVNDRIFAHEALLRGPHGETAAAVFARVHPDAAVSFDASCRRKAIQIATSLGLKSRLSLNISPDAACDLRHGVQDTLQATREYGLREDRLILEITERTAIADMPAVRRGLGALRDRGALIALDDFGAGYSGLVTLVGLKPDIIKLDMDLVREIEHCNIRQTLVASMIEGCDRLGILVVAEGIETFEEYRMLRALGVELMQGFFLGRPAFESLPPMTRGVSSTLAQLTAPDEPCAKPRSPLR